MALTPWPGNSQTLKKETNATQTNYTATEAKRTPKHVFPLSCQRQHLSQKHRQKFHNNKNGYPYEFPSTQMVVGQLNTAIASCALSRDVKFLEERRRGEKGKVKRHSSLYTAVKDEKLSS